MKVTLHKKQNLVKFGNLAKGDCFYYDDDPFLKVYCALETNPWRVINLRSHEVGCLADDIFVKPVDSELILTEYYCLC